MRTRAPSDSAQHMRQLDAGAGIGVRAQRRDAVGRAHPARRARRLRDSRRSRRVRAAPRPSRRAPRRPSHALAVERLGLPGRGGFGPALQRGVAATTRAGRPSTNRSASTWPRRCAAARSGRAGVRRGSSMRAAVGVDKTLTGGYKLAASAVRDPHDRQRPRPRTRRKRQRAVRARPRHAARASTPARIFSRPNSNDVFARDWVSVGRASGLKEPGDYIAYELAGQPIVVLRDGEGGLRAMSNVCRHRMSTLVEGRGSARAHRLPLSRLDLQSRRHAARRAGDDAATPASARRTTGCPPCAARNGSAGSW